MKLGQIKGILHFQESAVILIVVNGKTVSKIRKVNLLQRTRHYPEHLESSKEDETKPKKWSNDTLEHASTAGLLNSPNSNNSMSTEDAEEIFSQLKLKLYT